MSCRCSPGGEHGIKEGKFEDSTNLQGNTLNGFSGYLSPWFSDGAVSCRN
jgi:hypothetical protein